MRSVAPSAWIAQVGAKLLPSAVAIRASVNGTGEVGCSLERGIVLDARRMLKVHVARALKHVSVQARAWICVIIRIIRW